MSIVSCDDLRFSGLAWKFKLLPNKYMETSIKHAGPFISVFREQHRIIWHNDIDCCKQGSLYKTLLMISWRAGVIREYMIHKGVVIAHRCVCVCVCVDCQ